MERKVIKKVTGRRTQDGAGVSLVRVLGHDAVKEFDPILMLDSFDSINSDDYTAGFPMHPHRGIETISYVYKGKMIHKDSLGNTDAISDGEVQWMTAGSGIFHEELLPASERMLGVQLWLNLSAKDKMVAPVYSSIKNSEIQEIPIENGKIRLLAGSYGDKVGYQSRYLPFDYYDIHLNEGASTVIDTDHDRSVVVFSLIGDIYVSGELIKEKTAVKLTEGDRVLLESAGEKAQILFMSSIALKEPVAWAGPIVMNTEKELQDTFKELSQGTFLHQEIDYEK